MFNNKKLEQAIKYKIFREIEQDLTINDLEDIEEISLQNIDLKGNIIGIDLSELNKLSNLKMLSLKDFDLTDNDIKSLNNLRNFNITINIMQIYRKKYY